MSAQCLQFMKRVKSLQQEKGFTKTVCSISAAWIFIKGNR